MDAGTRDALPDQPSKGQLELERAQSKTRAANFLRFLADPAARSEAGKELFDFTALQGIENVQSDRPGHCSCEFPVRQRNANSGGTLHGGCAGVAPLPTTGTCMWRPCFCKSCSKRLRAYSVRDVG